ncbi:unnamed protein product [Euphydryas editha]|uniref:Uncharacterized protein n=1 Tax=Euphydryas editha TaxID=104508 RepID=A0AAU9TEE4_EUPED|nr:unnamed protein product [Euphydryas editha]
MSRHIFTLFFLNIFLSIVMAQREEPNKQSLENNLEVKFLEYSKSIVKWMKNIYYNNSNFEKTLRYNDIEPKMDNEKSEARQHKLMLPLLFIPLFYKLGVMSMLMILTLFLAKKSVTIGLILLVMKIIVSSSKLASLFTIWKYKKYQSELGWLPYHDHHNYHDYHDHHNFHDHHNHHVLSDTYSHPNYAPDWRSHPSLVKIPTSPSESEFSEKSFVKKPC